MSWFSSKKLCSHCNTTKTNKKFENAITCPQCESKILMAREGIRICPVDQTEMAKENHKGIILDRCSKCNGVWLDSDELSSMQELAIEDSDFATGMVIGMAIG
jgi:Zn-finger nucleic acid-binding protein